MVNLVDHDILVLVAKEGLMSSPDPTETSQAPRDVQVPDAGLVLAYDDACELLKMQDATLGNVRSRATQVLSTAALLTSISAGLGIINLDAKRGDVLGQSGAWALDTDCDDRRSDYVRSLAHSRMDIRTLGVEDPG